MSNCSSPANIATCVLEALAAWAWTPGLTRNAYLRVDGTGGTVIDSVGFENLTATDVLIFDHLAVAPAAAGVPEPGTWLLLAGALLGLTVRRYLAAAGR